MDALLGELEQRFNADIAAGRFQVGDTLPSLAAVQEQYGVGIPVARRFYAALKDAGQVMTSERQGTILLATRADARPVREVLRRGLVATGWLEVTNPKAQANTTGQAVRHLEEACRRRHIPFTFHNFADRMPNWTDPESFRIREADLADIRQLNPAGVVLLPESHKHPANEGALAGLGIPIVALGARRSLLPTVLEDEVAAGRVATRHLLDLGHRNTAFLAYGTEEYWMGDRIAGYRQALDAAGIAMHPEWVPRLRYDVTRLAETFMPDFRREFPRLVNEGCTAFVCGSDALGQTIIEYREAHPECPPVAFVTFGDDIDYCALNMTAVRHATEVQAQRAFELLLEKARNPNTCLQDEFVTGNLYVRSSSLAPAETSQV